MDDWFAQNAPKAKDEDWFAANSPGPVKAPLVKAAAPAPSREAAMGTTGFEAYGEALQDPEARAKQAAAVGKTLPVAAAVGVSMAMPQTLPLLAKAAISGAAMGTAGAAGEALQEHSTVGDVIGEGVKQAAYGAGGEFVAGALGLAHKVLRGLRLNARVAAAQKAATAAEATAPVSEAAAGAAGKAPPKVPPGTVAGTAEEISQRLGLLEKDPEKLMTMAVKPRSANIKWDVDLKRALPDLKAAEAEIGRPIAGVNDALEATSTAKSRLWAQYESKLGAAGKAGAVIDGNQIADAMTATIDARTAIQNPGIVKRIGQVADTYRRPMPVEEAEEFLQSANNELHSYYAKNKVGQEVAARDPETGHVVAEANALRKALYDKLDESVGPGSRELKQRYGALSNMEDELLRRKNVAARQQPESLAEQLTKARAYGKIMVGIARGDPWSILEGMQSTKAATFLKERQTTDAMIERAFRNYPSGGPAAPATAPASGVGKVVSRLAGSADDIAVAARAAKVGARQAESQQETR